jgi:hypothetical protein
MQIDKQKAELIVKVCGSQHNENVINILRLLDLLISEVRQDNDTEEGNGMYRNQGEIRGYKRLSGYILHGIPVNPIPNRQPT